MTPADDHPAFATAFAELDTRFLVDHTLARLLEDPTARAYDRRLAERIAAATDLPALAAQLQPLLASARVMLPEHDDAWEALHGLLVQAGERGTPLAARETALEAWRRDAELLLRRTLEGVPYQPREPLRPQLPPPAAALLDALATAERALAGMRGAAPELLLPAPVRVREEIPPLGAGPLEIIEVGDLHHPWSGEGHAMLEWDLGPVARSIRTRWLHGFDPDDPLGPYVASIGEVGLEVAPQRFWKIAVRVYGGYNDVSRRDLRTLASVIGISNAELERRVEDPAIRERVWRDQAMALACAIPLTRPVFVVGRRPFVGMGLAPSLRAHLERLAAAGEAR